jgi:uncharacterized damage-inducible protein DinB
MEPNEDNVATRLMLAEIVARMRTWLKRAIDCIDQLNDEQVWFRPNASSNAIGNLVLHLVGNLKQWILGGIGNQKDFRDRPAEFNAEAGYGSRELRELLRDTVEDACQTIEDMPPNRVREAKRIQDMDVTLAHAVVMAVSHLRLHVGQIQYIAKMLLSDAFVGSSEPREKQPK